jgi:folate-dependent phosphoribosylglycinamide formyltransferase PurN
VSYTSAGALCGELFLYAYAHLLASDAEVCVVAVRPPRLPLKARLARALRKCARLGLLPSLEILTSLPFQRTISRRHQRLVSEAIRALPRPDVRLDAAAVRYVPHTNGPRAVETLRSLEPAIVVQLGAGILRRQIFTIPSLGALNMHHGIAPAIRGMNSIYWALWERRPDWIGTTVHLIDEGLDTGRPLAYFRVQPVAPGEGFPSLYVRATEGGVRNLVSVVQRLLRGEATGAEPPPGQGVYRSTFSGWKMLLLERRLAKATKGQVTPGGCPPGAAEDRPVRG